MRYMFEWTIKEENILSAIERFKNNPPEPPPNVTMAGRWHQPGTGKGYTLIETDDPAAMAKFAVQWADLVDQVAVPVLIDEEIAEALS